jgi:GNAT superfamily N-acetyltransferase
LEIMTMHPAELIVADLALARRLERAEARANAEFVTARAAAFPDSGAEWFEVAGAHVMYDGPDSPCTQTFGLGMFEPVTNADLDRVEQFFRRRGAVVYHEICPLADASLIGMLNERGYQPFEFSSVLYRRIQALPPADASPGNSIQARRIERGEEKLWSRTAAEGWRDAAPGLDEFIYQLEQLIPHQPHGHNFVAERAGEAIAAGALFLSDGVALLAGASTIPKWRKQGAQRALLERRLHYGAEHGCDVAMIVAAPGSASQRNAEREGFRIAYTRIKWRLPLPVA